MADRMEPVAPDLRGIDAFEASEIIGHFRVGALSSGELLVRVADLQAIIERALSAQLAAAVAQARAEERSRYTALVDWLQDVGLLKAEHCQIDKPETLGYWWVLRKPYLIGQHVSYGKTEDEAIAAAIRQASEPATEGEKR